MGSDQCGIPARDQACHGTDQLLFAPRNSHRSTVFKMSNKRSQATAQIHRDLDLVLSFFPSSLFPIDSAGLRSGSLAEKHAPSEPKTRTKNQFNIMLKNGDFNKKKKWPDYKPVGAYIRWIWLMKFPFSPLSTDGSSQISTKKVICVRFDYELTF